MMKLLSTNKIYISQSKILNAGRGVFASGQIDIGEVIERCPFIEIPKDELERIESGILTNYVYFFGKEKERLLLALGFGSIYNHSYTPNAVYKIKPHDKTIEFKAVKNIKKDEEISVNYIQGNKSGLTLWFEAKEKINEEKKAMK